MSIWNKFFFVFFIIVYACISLILVACVWEVSDGDVVGDISLTVCVVSMYFFACVGMKKTL